MPAPPKGSGPAKNPFISGPFERASGLGTRFDSFGWRYCQTETFAGVKNDVTALNLHRQGRALKGGLHP